MSGPSHLRTAITLIVLVIVLLLTLVWGWTKLTEPLPGLSPDDSTSASPTACSPKVIRPGTRLRPQQVTVSVFNAGTIDGKATSTLTQLIERGFGPGDTGNAPRRAEVDKVQIWAADAKNPAVRLVAANLGRRVKVVAPTGAALGEGVVVVVGNDFDRLPKVTRSVRVTKAARVCVPNVP